MLKDTVAIALVWGQRIYLSRRYNTKRFNNFWQAPGGKVDDGENDIVSAAQRELEEETGLKVELSRLEYIGEIHDPSCLACHVYKVQLKCGEKPQLTEPDCTHPDGWRLYSREEIKKLKNVMPGLKGILKYLWKK